jgi:hypothetical protein
VTLYHEGTIVPDEVKLFEIPVPRELAKAKGRKSISVTVAYDPPVSLVRRDRPAGVYLTWGLARGDTSPKDVESAIAAAAEEEASETGSSDPTASTKTPSVFMPGDLPKRPQQRGTVQKNAFSWQRGDHGDTYHLAVTAKATRARDAKIVQRYAVVVTIECADASVNVYTAVRMRVVAARVRVRVDGS